MFLFRGISYRPAEHLRSCTNHYVEII